MNFIDLFAGIGGFRLGMEQAGHKCVGWVEWDKYARKSYQAIHDTEGEWTADDITTVTDDAIRDLGRRQPIHVITGGFPCQAFSIAGKRKGFADTRGTLFFEIARFASILRPKYLFCENVAGLLNHDNGNTFEVILATLDELGYDAEWQVCNSKNFGVPQNRERVFIIGHLRGECTGQIFPLREVNDETLVQIIPGADAERVYDPSGLGRCLMSGGGGWGGKTGLYMVGLLDRPGIHEFSNRVYSAEGIARTLMGSGGNNEDRTGLYLINKPIFDRAEFSNIAQTLSGGAENDKQPYIMTTPLRVKDGTKQGYTEVVPTTTTIDLAVPGSQTRRGRVKDGEVGALDTSCNIGVFSDDLRIRKLTPRECFRLQGFPDWAFDKAKEVNSDSQLYRQAGNSVTTNVIYEIARRLK